MTHPDPQAAPPETDLRLLERFECAVRESCDPAFSPKTQHKARHEVVETRTELLRRLARPDALRDKVMALSQQLHIDLIDARQDIELSDGESADLLQLEDVQDLIDGAFAAVAAVLEGDDNAS